MLNSDLLKNLTSDPGVYLMKNIRKTIIYIGKAKNLRKRVSSYFNKSNKDTKTQVMVSKVADLEVIVTKNELEALILEHNLIKKHKPRYNVLLKDDKSYPFIKIDTAEKFPKLNIIRRPRFNNKKREEILYGPFPNSSKLKENIRFINKLFKLRNCSESKFKNRSRPCINYDIGICTAPCVAYISRKDYFKQVDEVILFMKGHSKKLITLIKDNMKQASENLEYEKAAIFRDRLNELEALTEKQAVSDTTSKDMDAIGYYEDSGRIVIYVLFIRQGLLLGGAPYLLNIDTESHLDDCKLPNILEIFSSQYYSNNYIPEKIISFVLPETKELIEELLSQYSDKKPSFELAHKGKRKDLFQLACDNAKNYFLQKSEKIKTTSQLLKEIKKKLNLKTFPSTIDCFDISNFNGKNPVASKVVMKEGELDKKNYRYYKIKTDFKGEQNDYAMLAETISRAYSKDNPTPDLILIDGGKGQLNIIQEVLKSLNKDVACASIAKSRVSKDFKNTNIEKTTDRIFIPGRKNPVALKGDSPALNLLSLLRDEAHRFAITFQRKLSRKNLLDTQ